MNGEWSVVRSEFFFYSLLIKKIYLNDHINGSSIKLGTDAY